MKPLVYAPYLPTHAARAPSCEAATFSSLALDNVLISSLDATAQVNVTIPSVDSLPPTTRSDAATVDVCLVTIGYGHPGDGDNVTAWVALPLGAGGWNGRFLANGGGGWLAGDESRALSGAGSGYASASTDGGHGVDSSSAWPGDWGLRPDGGVNWPALEDFASRALVEAVRLGKQATEAYYGEAPSFSYWNGCSTGGRQGHGR